MHQFQYLDRILMSVTTTTMPRTDSSKERERNRAGLGGFYYQLAAQIREQWDTFIKSLRNTYSCIMDQNQGQSSH